MPDPYRSFRKGEPLAKDTETFNTFSIAARFARDNRANREFDSIDTFRQGDIVKIKNETGRALSRFSVVGLSAPIFLPGAGEASLNAFKRDVSFRGTIPTDQYKGKFAVLLEPADVGKFARAYVDGVCQVQVDVKHEGDTCCDVADDITENLVSTSQGGSAQILWAAGGTGLQWCMVRLGTNCRICCHSSSSSSSTSSSSGCREACPACAPSHSGCIMHFSVQIGEWDFITPPPSCVLMSCFYDVFHQSGCTWVANFGKANSSSFLPFGTIVDNTAILSFMGGSWQLVVMDPGGHQVVFKGGTFDCHTVNAQILYFSNIMCFNHDDPLAGCTLIGID